MATSADRLDQLLSTTFDKVKNALSDQITQETAVLAMLDSKGRISVDGGTAIVRPVMYALNSTVAAYSGYDTIDTTPQTGIGNAKYSWKQIAGSVTISGEEERKNMGGAQIIGLLSAKIDQLRLSFEDKFNAMLMGDGSGASNKEFMGLQGIVTNGDPASGALGGIEVATETWWKAVVSGVAGATSGFPTSAVDLTDLSGVRSLNQVYNNLHINKSNPDFELTTQANFEAYEALAAPNIRFTDLRMADLGFQVIAHKRAEVVLDPDVPAPGGSGGGFWYFLNTNHLEFVQHSAAWMLRRPFQTPFNQDAKTSLVLCMGNLITDQRRAHGVIKATVV